MARRGSRSSRRVSEPALRADFRPAVRFDPVRIRPIVVHRIDLGDRRLFHPLREVAPAAASVQRARRLVISEGVPNQFVSNRVKFADPVRVGICVRRKERREVLHALRKTGKGSGRSPKRRNWWSDIDC